MAAGLRVWLWVFVYNWIIGGDIICYTYMQENAVMATLKY